MAAASTIIAVSAVVGAAAALGGTAYQIKAGEDAKAQAKDQADTQKKVQQRALDEQAAKTKEEESNAEAIRVRDEQKRAQRAKSSGMQGRRGTILTSPLGETTQAQGAQPAGGKTLLGT